MRMFFFFIFLLFPSVAEGQEKKKEREIVYKERTEIDFEGVDIQGELVKPQGKIIFTRRKATFNPLIKLRVDFDVEMQNSISEVK